MNPSLKVLGQIPNIESCVIVCTPVYVKTFKLRFEKSDHLNTLNENKSIFYIMKME